MLQREHNKQLPAGLQHGLPQACRDTGIIIALSQRVHISWKLEWRAGQQSLDARSSKRPCGDPNWGLPHTPNSHPDLRCKLYLILLLCEGIQGSNRHTWNSTQSQKMSPHLHTHSVITYFLIIQFGNGTAFRLQKVLVVNWAFPLSQKQANTVGIRWHILRKVNVDRLSLKRVFI